MSENTGRAASIRWRRGAAGLALTFILAGCPGSGTPTGTSEAGADEQAPATGPTGSSPRGTTGDPTTADVDLEPGRLYRVDPRTGEAELLLSGAGAREPESSPDGSRLVYQSVVPGGATQIFVLEEDGTELQLTDLPGGAEEPTWSPDGSQIAFAARHEEARGDTDIFLMGADGSHILRLAGTARNDGHPDWSPDGSRIVFHSRFQAWDGILPRGELWVASVHDGELTRLDLDTPFWGGYWDGADPAWSPDGLWIAYSRLAGSTINGKSPYVPLWVMRSDGTGQRSLHRWKKRWGDCELEASWSPDGSSIAYIHAGSEASRIWIIDVQTREFDYISTPDPVADLSWGTEGILVRMGDGALERPPIRCA